MENQATARFSNSKEPTEALSVKPQRLQLSRFRKMLQNKHEGA